MPIITIQGMPDLGAAATCLESLIGDIQKSVAAITELNIVADDVTVFFPRDFVSYGLGEELVALVTGLIPREERTLEVKQKLLDAIRDAMADFAGTYLRQCKLVEVFLLPYELSSTKPLTRW